MVVQGKAQPIRVQLMDRYVSYRPVNLELIRTNLSVGTWWTWWTWRTLEAVLSRRGGGGGGSCKHPCDHWSWEIYDSEDTIDPVVYLEGSYASSLTIKGQETLFFLISLV